METILNRVTKYLAGSIDRRLKREKYVLILSVLFMFLAVLMPNVKAYFVLTVLYVLSLLIVTYSFEKALVYIFIPLSLLEIGQSYSFKVMPAGIFWPGSDLYLTGKDLFFTYSPFYIVLLVSILYLIVLLIQKKIRFSMFFNMALLMAFLTLLSAIKTEYYVELSVLNAVGLVGMVSWSIVTSSSLNRQNREGQFKMLNVLLIQVCSITLFEFVIAAVQFMLRRPIGILGEGLGVLSFSQYIVDQSSLFVRPVGFTGDPNELANYMLIYGGLIFFLLRMLAKSGHLYISKLFVYSALASAALSIVVAQSRSALVSLFMVLMGVVYLYKYSVQRQFKYLVYASNKYHFRGILLLALILTLGFVIYRLSHTVYSFTPTGGALLRTYMNKEAVQMFLRSPLLGVGPEMYISSAYDTNPSGVIRDFPFPVHNGWLLALCERGILTFIAFLFALFFLSRVIVLGIKDRELVIIFFVFLAAQFLNMFFHTFNNMLTLYTLLLGVVAFVKYEKQR